MNGRLQRALPAALVAAGVLCALGLWRVIAALFLPLPLDPNEGWNAYHAAAAISGAPLYAGAGHFMINNYPPLSFYLMGALGRLFGDAIMAGRLVSLASFGAVGWEIFALARRLGARPVEAVAGALLFAAALLASTDYVGMDDPQLLAEAIAGLGLLALIDKPQWTWRAAALFVLAFFVKQNVVAMALASALWLFLRDRHAGLRFMGFGLVLFCAGLLLFRFAYGVSLLSQLASARSYSWSGLRDGIFLWLGWSFVPLAGLVVLAALLRRDEHVRLAAIMAALGIAIGVSFLGGAGVDQNVMFDADIALALGAALLLNRLAPDWRGALLAIVCAVPLLFTAKAQADADWNTADYWLHPFAGEAASSRSDIAFLRTHPGPALCEMLSFCYWAGKRAGVDVFNAGEAIRTGAMSDAPLVRAISKRRFSVIQFDADSSAPLGNAVDAAIRSNYRLDHQDDVGSFYVPR
jgi:hypothetical protein